MTKAPSKDDEEVAAMIRQLVDIDGHTVLDTPAYKGFCIVYNQKPFIVVVLEGQVCEQL